MSERPGNIALIAHIRELVRHLEGTPGPRLPTLLKRVIYDGTHTGDFLPAAEAENLLSEVELILHSSDILSDSERIFFETLRLLCNANIEAGNPIMF